LACDGGLLVVLSLFAEETRRRVWLADRHRVVAEPLISSLLRASFLRRRCSCDLLVLYLQFRFVSRFVRMRASFLASIMALMIARAEFSTICDVLRNVPEREACSRSEFADFSGFIVDSTPITLVL